MNELEYWLDKRKLTGADDNAKLTTAKNKFQQLFLLTDSNGKNIVFEKIWANIGLRGNLWNTRDYPNITENQAKIVFSTWVSALDNKVFNFIKVK